MRSRWCAAPLLEADPSNLATIDVEIPNTAHVTPAVSGGTRVAVPTLRRFVMARFGKTPLAVTLAAVLLGGGAFWLAQNGIAHMEDAPVVATAQNRITR
jgi:hypothetical protein